MKHLLIAFCFSSLLYSSASAQTNEAYFGLGLSYANIENPSSPNQYFPTLAVLVQVGLPVSPSVGLRAALGSVILLDNGFSVDLLYSVAIQDDLKVYLGLGPDVTWQRTLSTVNADTFALDGHGTAGIEYRLPYGLGLFAEVQTLLLSSITASSPLINLRGGLNIYF